MMHHFAPPMNRAPYNHPPQGYLSFEERRRRFEEIGTSPPTKDNIQQNRFLHDRKRRNDGEEIATTHTPKKICKSAVFLPPPPAASTTINVFPKEVINELKNKLDKRPNTVQPSSSIMAPPASCQKGLVQLMERNRKAPSYSTSSATSRSVFANRSSPSYSASTASRSTAASRYNIPSYRTSGTSNVSNFDSASTTSTTSSIFSRSFVPKERPKQKKPDEKCSIS